MVSAPVPHLALCGIAAVLDQQNQPSQGLRDGAHEGNARLHPGLDDSAAVGERLLLEATGRQAGDDGGGTGAEQGDGEAEIAALARAEPCDAGEQGLHEGRPASGISKGVWHHRLGDCPQDCALGG